MDFPKIIYGACISAIIFVLMRLFWGINLVTITVIGVTVAITLIAIEGNSSLHDTLLNQRDETD